MFLDSGSIFSATRESPSLCKSMLIELADIWHHNVVILDELIHNKNFCPRFHKDHQNNWINKLKSLLQFFIFQIGLPAPILSHVLMIQVSYF